MAYTLVFVATFVMIGKCCQYAGVALLGDRLGFEASAAIGLLPFVVALLVAKTWWPRWFDWRSR